MTEKVSGIRGSVEILNPFEALFGTTWENFHSKHVSKQEYGWTKYNDLTVTAYFFKHRFNASRAAEGVGYAPVYIGCGKYKTNGASLMARINKLNSIDLLDVARAMIFHKLLTVEDITHILADPFNIEKPHPGTKKMWNSPNYIKHAAMIVNSSIKKCGTKKMAASKLKVTAKTLNFWIKANKGL